jgi:arginyl-tRNA--protein-N-Asp/Glu arginylyltransferase
MNIHRYLRSFPHSCGYVTDQKAITKFFHPSNKIDNDIYSELSMNGFRRSGQHAYIPDCPSCTKCIPARLKVTEFKPRKSHLRTIKRNSDLIMTKESSTFSNEHFQLYQSYVSSRHADSPMLNLSRKEFIGFLTAPWSETFFLEFRYEKKLLAVAAIDILRNGISSVYTFFCPSSSQRGLGNFAILKQIEMAAELNLEWLYLGYWLRDCKKMSYKTNFQPIQLMTGGKWRYPYQK